MTLSCYARDKAGKYLMCSAYNPPSSLIAAVQTIQSDSYVSFTLDSTAGTCTDIWVRLSSTTEPKN